MTATSQAKPKFPTLSFNGKPRWGIRQVCHKLKRDYWTILRWNEKACPYLEGATLEGDKLAKDPDTGRRLLSFDQNTILKVKKKIAEVDAGHFIDANGLCWLSGRYCAKELGIKRKRTFDHLFWKWRRDWRALDGSKLRTNRFPFRRNEDWMLDTHFKEIKRSYRRRGKSAGFDGIFEEPVGRRFTVPRASEQSNFSLGFLYGCIDELPALLTPYFPQGKGKLPNEDRVHPGKRHRKNKNVTTISEKDLNTLRDAVDDLLQKGTFKRLGKSWRYEANGETNNNGHVEHPPTGRHGPLKTEATKWLEDRCLELLNSPSASGDGKMTSKEAAAEMRRDLMRENFTDHMVRAYASAARKRQKRNGLNC
jgi:hypothetical protein